MDKSKFSMWRASFAFCHVDSTLSHEEKEWIESKLKSLPFSKEEQELIRRDIKNPPKVEELFLDISNPVDKGFLVNEMRKLAHLDDNFSASEKEKIAKIQSAVMSKINLAELESEVRSQGATAPVEYDNFLQKFVKRS